MGKRTSVYLTGAQVQRIADLGTTLPVVIRAGLDALEGDLILLEARKARVAGKPHGDPDHACSWACPQCPDPFVDVRAVKADIGAGMTEAELLAKHYRPGPFSFGPEVPLPAGLHVRPVVAAVPVPGYYHPCCDHCVHGAGIVGHGARCLQCPA